MPFYQINSISKFVTETLRRRITTRLVKLGNSMLEKLEQSRYLSTSSILVDPSLADIAPSLLEAGMPANNRAIR